MLRILYIANHSKGQNDNEGAITHALRALGHKVTRFNEREQNVLQRVIDLQHENDFVLFQKWGAKEDLAKITIPKVFWYFDLVNFSDSTLAKRNLQRIDWMRRTIPHVSLGFCTDGDWVEQDTSGKLIKLTQGADERVSKLVVPAQPSSEIVCTCQVRGGGTARGTFVEEMQKKFGDKFRIVGNVFRDELAPLFAKCAIVVAPDAPVTDRYYSNRVYNSLNFGAFLLHPCSMALDEEYENGKDLLTYFNRKHLFDLIEAFIDEPQARDRIRMQGHLSTIGNHTYRHRCEVLIKTIQERLF